MPLLPKLASNSMLPRQASGVAKFSYTQALNSLYVAQAAKQASDKAIAIAYAQGVAAN
jgi:hypothetical protein